MLFDNSLIVADVLVSAALTRMTSTRLVPVVDNDRRRFCRSRLPSLSSIVPYSICASAVTLFSVHFH